MGFPFLLSCKKQKSLGWMSETLILVLVLDWSRPTQQANLSWHTLGPGQSGGEPACLGTLRDCGRQIWSLEQAELWWTRQLCQLPCYRRLGFHFSESLFSSKRKIGFYRWCCSEKQDKKKICYKCLAISLISPPPCVWNISQKFS